MSGPDDELEAALRAMESGFHVGLIGTFANDLLCAPADADAGIWLAENGPNFDQFPVREGDAVVGLLLRPRAREGTTVRETMRPLCEEIIVSGDLPIADLIPMLRTDHCRLVLRGGKLDGLVTQSDLLKLPVRMLLFGLVSHLEACMREGIRAYLPESLWQERLSPDSRRKLRGRIARLKESRFEPDPLELTDFVDAMDVLASIPAFGQAFWERADQIRKLRNDVDHAKTFIESPEDVHAFVKTYEDAHELIRTLSTFAKAA